MIRRHGYKSSRYAEASKRVASGRALETVGRLEDALAEFKNARTWLAEVRSNEGAALRDEVGASIARLESDIGVADTSTSTVPGVAKTEPSDLDVLGAMVEQRRPLEDVMAKKAGGRER